MSTETLNMINTWDWPPWSLLVVPQLEGLFIRRINWALWHHCRLCESPSTKIRISRGFKPGLTRARPGQSPTTAPDPGEHFPNDRGASDIKLGKSLRGVLQHKRRQPLSAETACEWQIRWGDNDACWSGKLSHRRGSCTAALHSAKSSICASWLNWCRPSYVLRFHLVKVFFQYFFTMVFEAYVILYVISVYGELSFNVSLYVWSSCS